MPDVDLLPVAVATIAVFGLSFAYYSALGAQLAEVSEATTAGAQPPPWKLGVELLRSLILATVVAGLASRGEIDEWTGGLALGLALWIGFPFVLWTGAILWEGTRFKLAALHAGDWLVKLLVVAVIVSVWS
jgi:hypothetical protein